MPVGRDRDGNITIEYKPFGVGLGFTPVVLSEGRISLRISTEVSELSNQGSITLGGSTQTDADGNVTGGVPALTIPSLTVNRAETTVELPSGGSLVICRADQGRDPSGHGRGSRSGAPAGAGRTVPLARFRQ